MDDDGAYTPIPDEEEPLIQTRPRTRRIRYAVGAASLMLAAATAARATRPQPQQELFSLSQCPAALAQDIDPTVCAAADAEQCAHLCTDGGNDCQTLCADATLAAHTARTLCGTRAATAGARRASKLV